MSRPTGVYCKEMSSVCDEHSANISWMCIQAYIGCIPTDTSKYGDAEFKGCQCVCLNKEGNKMYVSRGRGWTGTPGRVKVYVQQT